MISIIQGNLGIPRAFSIPLPVASPSRRKGSSVAGTGHPQPLCIWSSAPGSAWESPQCPSVPELLGHGDSPGAIRDCCFCPGQGPAPWVLCSFALSDGQQESPAGSWVSFVIPWWPISAPHAENWSGPSGEQTLSSGHLPFEAFQKGEGALKTEKLLEIGLLTNKN